MRWAAGGLYIPLFILPLHALARERLLRLEAPLWAHELGTGQPLLASAQAAPFAPLHLMALPLPPVRRSPWPWPGRCSWRCS